MADRIADLWGERTPFTAGGNWPERMDQFLTVDEDRVERWVQSACVLCSNGCGMDVAVAGGRIAGVRGRGGPGQPRPAGLEGPVWLAGGAPLYVGDSGRRPV